MLVSLWRTIRWRLLATLLAAIGIFTVIIAATWRLSIEPALRLGVARAQQEVAWRAADQIAEFIEHRLGELTATAEIGRLWEEEPTRRKEALYRLLKVAPPIDEVALVDGAGHDVVRLSRTQVYTADTWREQRETELFRQAMGGNVYVGPVYHGRTLEPFVTIAVPIRFTARQARAVLRAEVRLITLWGTISHIKVGQTGYAFVVDRKGVVIAHPDLSSVLLGTPFTRHRLVEAFLKGVPPTLGEPVTSLDGRRVLGTYAPVRQTGWTVVVEEPVASALAGVLRVEYLALGVVLAALAGAFAISYRFSRQIVRPLRELQEGAERIASGQLDYRLALTTGDELEILGGQFNHMAAKLRGSYEELRTKVVEKSRDLAALYAVSTPIARDGDLRTVLDRALGRIVQVLDIDAAAVRLDDGPEHGAFDVSVGAPAPLIDDTVMAGAWAGEVILACQPAPGPRSIAYVPLNVDNRVIGVLALAAVGPERLGPTQRDLLAAIGHQLAVSIENLRLYDEVQRVVFEVRARNAELDAFAYSVSHDLKTPLVTLQGMASLLMEDYGAQLDGKGAHYLQRMQANVDQMARLIFDLLTLSRVGREAQPAELVDMATLLEDVQAELADPIAARQAKIVVHEAPPLWGLRVQVQQVMTNLIGNALKYAGEQTPLVEIGATEQGTVVEYWVRDNGIGIEPAYHEKIFEIFQRLNEVETEGTGVGLTLVRKIVWGAGGSLRVESASGQGATFFFTWPRERPARRG